VLPLTTKEAHRLGAPEVDQWDLQRALRQAVVDEAARIGG
tara:strand:+ start:245 stop:364 length:120 start_codon:yes stop_codon:yes gene_type:complete